MCVLVAEDEVKLAAVLVRFTNAQYTVDLALNGREALDFALTADYDLMILDVMLPEVTVFTFASAYGPSGNRRRYSCLRRATRSRTRSAVWIAARTTTSTVPLACCWRVCEHCSDGLPNKNRPF